MKNKKYYLLTTSTSTEDDKLVNNTIFVEGNEMPSWKLVQEKVCNKIKNCGFEPKKDSTVILYMARLTKQEYEALQDKEDQL